MIAPATHDTAPAVVAVPAEGGNIAWQSSGTWSLLGGVSDRPIVTADALAANFSSFGSADGGCLPWKNIAGLWLVQECRRVWSTGGRGYSYEQLMGLAAEARPCVAAIDPDEPSFMAPADMPTAIRDFCAASAQAMPETDGEIVRTSLESLALKYRRTIE